MSQKKGENVTKNTAKILRKKCKAKKNTQKMVIMQNKRKFRQKYRILKNKCKIF